MGFDSAIKKLKKYPNREIAIKDALQMYNYCKFEKWLKSDWCQNQIKRGHEFKFEDSYPMYKDVPMLNDKALYDFYTQIVASESGDYDEDNYIADWCSAGRYIHDLIRESSHALYDGGYYDYYEIRLDDLKDIEDSIDDWMKTHRLVRVTLNYALKYNDDDSITSIPVDSIEVVTEDGFIKRLSADDEIYIPAKYCDDSERYAYESLDETVKKLKSFDFNNYYIYYYGGD